MTVDIGQLAPNLEPEFGQWRTGAGDAAEWILVADASAEGGRAIAQVSQKRPNIAFRSRSISRSRARTSKSWRASNRSTARSIKAGSIAVRLRTPDNYYVLPPTRSQGDPGSFPFRWSPTIQG